MPATTDGANPEWSVMSPHSLEQVANSLASFFEAEGYKLESGVPTDGIYGIGSDVMRVLFGAFAKRYSFNIKVVESGSGSTVFIDKAISGAMGGAIGYSKMKKELVRIQEGAQKAVC